MSVPVPANGRAIEALAYARDFIAMWKCEDLLGLGVPALDPQAGHIFVRRHLKALASSHPLNMMSVVDYARAGWDEADAALRELAVEVIDRGERMPTALGAYVMGLIRPGGPRGPKKATKAMQDVFLAILLSILVERFGLNPTRNSATQMPCACDVAAQAVNEARIGRQLAYKALEGLWFRWGKACLCVRPVNF
jgi:hypothetical protein